MWKERSLPGRAKMGMSDGIRVPILLYRCRAWAIENIKYRMVGVLEIKCLSTTCGLK